MKLLGDGTGTSLGSTKNVLDFSSDTAGQVGQGEVLRTVKDVKNLGDGVTKGLGDLAFLADEFRSSLVFRSELGRGLFVDNAGLDAVNFFGVVDCRKKEKKKERKEVLVD